MDTAQVRYTYRESEAREWAGIDWDALGGQDFTMLWQRRVEEHAPRLPLWLADPPPLVSSNAVILTCRSARHPRDVRRRA